MKPMTVLVTGRFECNGKPVRDGIVQFLPERCWVAHAGTFYGCLGPTTDTDENGCFSVRLTPTDSDAVCWKYKVFTPAGEFRVEVPWSEIGHTLADLIRPRTKR